MQANAGDFAAALSGPRANSATFSTDGPARWLEAAARAMRGYDGSVRGAHTCVRTWVPLGPYAVGKEDAERGGAERGARRRTTPRSDGMWARPMMPRARCSNPRPDTASHSTRAGRGGAGRRGGPEGRRPVARLSGQSKQNRPIGPHDYNRPQPVHRPMQARDVKPPLRAAGAAQGGLLPASAIRQRQRLSWPQSHEIAVAVGALSSRTTAPPPPGTGMATLKPPEASSGGRLAAPRGAVRGAEPRAIS